MKKTLLGLALATVITSSAFGLQLASGSGSYLNANFESLNRVHGVVDQDNSLAFKDRTRFHLSGKAKVNDQYSIGFFGRAEVTAGYADKEFSYSALNFRKAVLNVSKTGLGTFSWGFFGSESSFGSIYLGTALDTVKSLGASGVYNKVYGDSMNRGVKFVSERFGDNVYSVSYADRINGFTNFYEVDANVKTTLADKLTLSTSLAAKYVKGNIGKANESSSYKGALQVHLTDESLVPNLKTEVAAQAAYNSYTSTVGYSALTKFNYKVNDYVKPYLGTGLQYTKNDSDKSLVATVVLGLGSDLYNDKVVSVSSYVEGVVEREKKDTSKTVKNVTTTTTTDTTAKRYEAGVLVKF